MWPISIAIPNLRRPDRAMTVRVVGPPSDRRFARWWSHVIRRDIPQARALYAVHPEVHPLRSDPMANPEVTVDEDYGILLYQLSFDVPGWPGGDPDAPIPLRFSRPYEEME